MSTSRETNNAAIRLIPEGRHEEARDLLRQALELRVRENNHHHNNPQQQAPQHPAAGVALLQHSLLRCVTPDNHHPANRVVVVENDDSIPSSSTQHSNDVGDVNNAAAQPPRQAAEEEDAAQASSSSSSSSLQLAQQHPPPPAPPPLVYNINNNVGAVLNVPFEINDSSVAADTAVIVYNMALSFQLQGSWKARLFYEVSAILQLVRGIYLPLLDWMTMHNLRVWHHTHAQGNLAAHQVFAMSLCAARWHNHPLLEAHLVDAMLVNLQVSTQTALMRRERESESDNNSEHV